MPSEQEKRDAVYECLHSYQSPADIIRFLGYPKQTVYDIKKQFYVEMAVNGNVAKGLAEPSPVRKNHRDSLNKVNDNFTGELQRMINRDPGRAMRGLAADMGVAECTIRRYVKLHIRYKSYKWPGGALISFSRMGPLPTMPK